uniref:LPS export ABC transporter periplasmic protein LptC n=1 Tax=mine drainage metagenome TaxID=410659 RepID=E6Q3V2_9ZZZZ
MRFRGKRIGQREIAIAIGTLVGIWLVGGFIIAGLGPVPEPPGLQPIVLKGGKVRGNRIATKSWSFDYTRARLSPDGTNGNIQGVRHGIILRKGKPYAELSAEDIEVNTQTLDFTAIGKVHIVRLHDPQKRSFDTDFANWINSIQTLTMPHPSYFHTGGATLKVAKITMNFKTGAVKLSGVSGNILVAH